MSKRHPECQLYNHNTCKELDNPHVCAIVREDRSCTQNAQERKMEPVNRKNSPEANHFQEGEGIMQGHKKTPFVMGDDLYE